MDVANIAADLHALVEADRRAANRAVLVQLAIAVGVGSLVGFCLWQWTAVEWLLVTEPHVSASIGYGIIVALGVVTALGTSPGNWTVSDEALQRLSAADVKNRENLKWLQERLQERGYVTMDQFYTFIAEEARERERLEALNRPGAKAMLRGSSN